MGLASTIARRSLLGRKGRTVLSVLGIAVGIATAVGVVTLDESTVRGLSTVGRSTGPDLEVSGKGVESGEDLRSLEGVLEAVRYFTNDATLRALSVDPQVAATRRVRLFGFESESLPALGAHRLLEGRELRIKADGTRDREVLVGARLAAELELEVGDEVMLSRPRRIGRKTCVDGELVAVGSADRSAPTELSFEVVGILAPERLGVRGRGEVVIIDHAWGEQMYEGVRVSDRYWLKRDQSVDLERLETSLGRVYSYELNRSVVRGEQADERAFRTGVRMAGLLALVLGLYVIFHTLSMSLAERLGEVGTLHALGVTRAQVARIFLLEALFLAGAGALTGLAGGLGLAKLLLVQGITTLGAGRAPLELVIPWLAVLPLVLAGFGIALIGAVYPLSRLGGTSTVAALRGEEDVKRQGVARGFHLFTAVLLAIVLPGLYFVIVPVVGEYTAPLVGVLLGGVGFLSMLVVLPLVMPRLLTLLCAALARPFASLWPLAGRLAARTMSASATRIAVSASAIALVSAGFVGLKGMTRSLRGEVEVWAQEAVVDKVWVKGLPDVQLERLAQHLHAAPGILGVESGSARVHGSFLMLGVDPGELARYGPCQDDPSLIVRMRRQHGMIMSKRLARERQYVLGDMVPVAKADGSVQEFEVIAISDAYGYHPHPDERMYGLIAAENVKQYFCIDTDVADEVAIRLAAGTDPEVVRAALGGFEYEVNAGAAPRRGDGRQGSSSAGRAAGDAAGSGSAADQGDAAAALAPLRMGRIRIETGRELLAHHVMDIGRDFVLFDVLIFLTAALAALGVLNGQLLAALERSKEIGVLKALGVSRGQVAGMVLLESLVVGVVGGAIGVLLGASLTPVVIGALEELAGLILPSRGAGPWLGLAFGGAALLALSASLYPIWRMNRFDALRAVRSG